MPIVRSRDGPYLQKLVERVGRAAGVLMCACFSGPGLLRKFCCMLSCTLVAVSLAEGSVLWANKVRKRNLKRPNSLEMHKKLKMAKARTVELEKSRSRAKRAVSSCQSEEMQNELKMAKARIAELEKSRARVKRAVSSCQSEDARNSYHEADGLPRLRTSGARLRVSRCTPAPCTPDSRRDVGNGRVSLGGQPDDAVPIIPCRAFPPNEDMPAESVDGEGEEEEEEVVQEEEYAEEVMSETQDVGMQMEDDDHSSAAEEQECVNVQGPDCENVQEVDCAASSIRNAMSTVSAQLPAQILTDEAEEEEKDDDEQMDIEEGDVGTPQTPSTSVPNVSEEADAESVNKRCSVSSATKAILSEAIVPEAIHEKQDEEAGKDPEDCGDEVNDDTQKVSGQIVKAESEPCGTPEDTKGRATRSTIAATASPLPRLRFWSPRL